MTMCSGRCREKSAVVRLYDPHRLLPVDPGSRVWFERAAYCINAGCGWKQKWPAVELSISEASKVGSSAIANYLQGRKKVFPMLDMDKEWFMWLKVSSSNFEDFLRRREAMRQKKVTQPDLFDEKYNSGLATVQNKGDENG